MHHHVAVFRWKPDIDPRAVVAFVRDLRSFASTLPGLVSFACGSDLRLRGGNDDFAISAIFDSEETLLGYLRHPEHLRIVRHHASEMVADKHGAQFVSAPDDLMIIADQPTTAGSMNPAAQGETP